MRKVNLCFKQVVREQEPHCYWYHPDHLGSASWVTSSNGDVVQYLYYLPWGEDYLNQRRSGYEGSRYTFSAKEKDTETGYSYFGSRYYSSDLSIWLSVDPMSDKYPSLSPYVYCANNPIKLVDPNGEQWEDEDSENLANTLIKQAKNRQANFSPDSKEYKLLQEGIDGLIAMGEEKGQKYGFKESDFGKGCITKENGTIYMNYYNIENQPEQKDASAWHEAVHLTRYNKWKQYGEQKSMTQFTWKSINDRKSLLSFRSNDFFEETYTTYSTMLFSPTSVRFNNGTNAEDLIGVKQYMVNKDKYKTLNYNGFRLSDGLNGTWLKSK